MPLSFLTILFVLLSAVLSVSAQQVQHVTKFIDFGVSTNAFKGDLSHSYTDWANAVHIGLKFNKKKRINGHFNLMVGNAFAQNPDYRFDNGITPQPSPATFVKISLITVHYEAQLNLYKNKNWAFYLYQGIGICRFDPRDSENKKLSDQLNTRAQGESYSNVTIALPNGIGASYLFTNGFAVGFQAGWLNTNTDYLDNTSKWGDRAGNDNILSYKMSVFLPLKKLIPEPPLPLPSLE